MVELVRYRICQGIKETPHEQELLGPSIEDNYNKYNEFCTCSSNSCARKVIK